MDEYVLYIKNRNKDLEDIKSLSNWIEEGIRSVCIMYHEHSKDKNSFDNIMMHKDNIHYRVLSAVHGYIDFERNLQIAELSYLDYVQRKPNIKHLDQHPILRIAEYNLSGNFDSIVYHISSIFDYLSQIICYMMLKNKQKTVIWDKLIRKGDANTEIKDLNVKPTIIEVNRNYTQKLYKYRSRLIHNKRDKHEFIAYSYDIDKSECEIRTYVSKELQKQFSKQIIIENQKRITLTYFISWMIRQTFKNIELILDDLVLDIQNGSTWPRNLEDKKHQLNLVYLDNNTGFGIPVSEQMFKIFKSKKEKFRNDIFLPYTDN